MKITKEHLGKRLLIRKNVGYYAEPVEAGLMEVSPSGDYLKIQFVKCDNTTYTDWVSVDRYNLIEVLASKADQIADILKEGGQASSKDYSDNFTVTNEQYERESRKALEKELKKNKWVHGICNPPSPDWKATNSQKEYVECCKSTGKRYNSVKEMVDHLSNIKYNL